MTVRLDLSVGRSGDDLIDIDSFHLWLDLLGPGAPVNIPIRIIVATAIVILTLGHQIAPAQEPESNAELLRSLLSDDDADTPEPTNEEESITEEGGNDEEDAAADLEKLLDIADNDFEKLSQVRVQPQTVTAQPSTTSGSAPVVEQFKAAPSLATEVSTITRTKTTVRQIPAAVTVVTSEMIRRSGANNLPDVLRMVPGVQVARLDANKWSISIRGFNGRFANKLLVQIDGRSVYTPLFGGTFWDVQDVPLDNIDRIEIVRGPGATVWGANAVNGVINIITKNASETQGLYLRGGAGTEERGFTTAQYGGRISDAMSYRVYGKWFERDKSFEADQTTHDDWRQARGGFRVDWEPDDVDHVKLQGDFYGGTSGQRSIYPTLGNADFVELLNEDAQVQGENLVFNWTRTLSDDEDWSLTMFYDRTGRELDGIGFRENRRTFDVDFQRGKQMGCYNRVVWGLGYRHSADEINGGAFSLSYDPIFRHDETYSGFIQDEIKLTESLSATLGAKMSDNNYTGFEFQPTARLVWTPSETLSVWSSISRAVRTPTRSADDVRLIQPPIPLGIFVFPVLTGNRAIESEDLTSVEAGIRSQPNDWLSWDVAGYYNDYRNLIAAFPNGIGFDPQLGLVTIPVQFNNDSYGRSFGVEWTSHWKMTEGWEMHAAYSHLNLEVFPDRSTEGDSARNQLYLSSAMDLLDDVELDIAWRYVDSLPTQLVNDYHAMDIRVAWRPSENFEWSFVGRNLLDQSHPEFGDDTLTGVFATEVQREFFSFITIRR